MQIVFSEIPVFFFDGTTGRGFDFPRGPRYCNRKKGMEMDSCSIIGYFYPEDTPLRRLLLKHSCQVRRKALEILSRSRMDLDAGIVAGGAMLHDVGIVRCFAPGILCQGENPYIAHGVLGGAMLREYGARFGLDLERFARICERHTGSGLSAGDVKRQALPLPPGDYLPETPEEKLICLADKFFSKSGDMREKSPEKIFRSMRKFGPEAVVRLEELFRFFRLEASIPPGDRA